MEEIVIVALTPFYVCACAIAAAITLPVIKAGVAMFGNAQEMQDEKSK